jgi:hypothetical protein
MSIHLFLEKILRKHASERALDEHLWTVGVVVAFYLSIVNQ